jgi:hypothetical protein
MITLGEVIDAWATSQPKQFIIVYGRHRPWPGIFKEDAVVLQLPAIVCQWCAKVIGYIYNDTKRISMYPHQYDNDLVPAHPDFFEKLKKAIRECHHCVEDKYV